MRIEELQAALLLLLSTQLGTYTIAGTPTPAIATLASGEGLPNNRAINGLELVIVRSPLSYDTSPVYGEQNIRKTWQVFLTQYNGTYTIDDAVIRVLSAFEKVRASSITVSENKNIKTQYSLKIPDLLDIQSLLGDLVGSPSNAPPSILYPELRKSYTETSAEVNSDGDVTLIKIWDSIAKTKLLITKRFTYSAGILTQIAITDFRNTMSYTKTLTYDAGGNLSAIEVL